MRQMRNKSHSRVASYRCYGEREIEHAQWRWGCEVWQGLQSGMGRLERAFLRMCYLSKDLEGGGE